MKLSKKKEHKLMLRQRDYDNMISKPSFNAQGYKRPGSLKK